MKYPNRYEAASALFRDIFINLISVEKTSEKKDKSIKNK